MKLIPFLSLLIAPVLGEFLERMEIGTNEEFICSYVKPIVESELSRTFSTFKPVSYKVETGTGTTYLMQIATETDEVLHLKIFLGVEEPPKLIGVISNLSTMDELEDFYN
mmetsp:Transcript_23524/g.23728  ORF Transcript_23524/g.23728 Transcript_23524/m.23728 type:complete len:110 (+) Transcript_23524:143-472(+)|eukprot:CAMPEP_0182422350 /NCGR_PEP_ID=MMETSP1167-20130531/8011_1 /TAXON_ID=2988 /ORGANISM="Mallomonas Sp, Strain CCMP3275" /LENGTH=109 /DNA_ID=CAMNT_0024600335 /DNA_START=132 /DNA_END=461 /DNA_ORIENTATION=-